MSTSTRPADRRVEFTASGARRSWPTSELHDFELQGRKLPPLHWWRRLPADAFTAPRLQRLRRAMSGIGMVGEPRWPDAVRGYPKAAVALASKAIGQGELPLPIIDLTASTLVIPALAGDALAIKTLTGLIRLHSGQNRAVIERSWYGRRRRQPADEPVFATADAR